VVLAGLVGLLSVMLLGTQGGPPFTGDTSPVPVLRLLRPVLRHGADPAGDRRHPPRRPELKGTACLTTARWLRPVCRP
jgi:hypothetical protein